MAPPFYVGANRMPPELTTEDADRTNAELLPAIVRMLLAVKAGQRHSAADQKMLNTMHDTAVELGASCGASGKSVALDPTLKVNYEQAAADVRRAWEDQSMAADRYAWVMAVFDTAVIVVDDGKLYRVTYTTDAEGAITFAEEDAWEDVRQIYVTADGAEIKAAVSAAAPTPPAPAVKTLLPLTAFGGTVKAVGDAKLRGPGVVFGGRDLIGDTFEPSTDYGAARSFVGMPVYYDHTLSGVKSQVGVVTGYEFKDDRIDFEIELDKRKAYLQDILRLVGEKALGLSTATMPHTFYAERGAIKRWIIGEISLTPTPAEPRTSVEFVKILVDEQPRPLDDLYVIM
jgi:hypothetical protein